MTGEFSVEIITFVIQITKAEGNPAPPIAEGYVSSSLFFGKSYFGLRSIAGVLRSTQVSGGHFCSAEEGECQIWMISLSCCSTPIPHTEGNEPDSGATPGGREPLAGKGYAHTLLFFTIKGVSCYNFANVYF